VQVKRETRSYFWLLIPVIVKVSSKSNGSDMVAIDGVAGIEVASEFAIRQVNRVLSENKERGREGEYERTRIGES
jgi:hypothetical protein